MPPLPQAGFIRCMSLRAPSKPDSNFVMPQGAANSALGPGADLAVAEQALTNACRTGSSCVYHAVGRGQ